MDFTIVSPILQRETIAAGPRIRNLRRLCKRYGTGRWRKLKGTAWIRLPAGDLVLAELHWYEAPGVGKVEMKIKHILQP